MPSFSQHAKALLAERDIRLAFFDIDGTLLGLDGNYSARVRDAIAAVRARGIRTAVASGRPLYAARFIIDELQLRDAGMFNTGALIYDPASDTRLAMYPLDDTLVARLLDAALDMGLYTEVCSERHFFVEQLTDLGLSHIAHLRVRPDECHLQSLVGTEPILKLLFAVQSRSEHELLYDLERRFADAQFAYAHMASEPDWLFASVISQQGCKQRGFRQLLDYHAVSADQVITFGDAHSDMTFLSLAGVGVAMGNASAEVKAVADFVTAPVWADGVALVLEQLPEQ